MAAKVSDVKPKLIEHLSIVSIYLNYEQLPEKNQYQKHDAGKFGKPWPKAASGRMER
jgi:hypothetical protein